MNMAVEFLYILTMFICVAAFSVHMTVKLKKLPSVSRLAKQNSTTFFLAVVLLTNLWDCLIIYLSRVDPGTNLTWFYAIENVLEVIMIYAVILMEGEYFQRKIPRALESLFAVICLILLYLDGVLDLVTMGRESLYFSLMILINAIPIIILIILTILLRVKSGRKTDYRHNAYYLISLNIFCVFLCVVCTMSNIDQQTVKQFINHSKELYELIFLIFNILTFAFVWLTIKPQDSSAALVERTLEERVATAAESWGLSPREQEMARLLCLGKNNQEMARELYLSINTVKVHLSNLYHKIGAANRVQAVRILNGEKEYED